MLSLFSMSLTDKTLTEQNCKPLSSFYAKDVILVDFWRYPMSFSSTTSTTANLGVSFFYFSELSQILCGSSQGKVRLNSC